METHRKHIPVWQIKKAQRLDKQAEKVKQSLEDITMFNAGKKREEALEALVGWLPTAERFAVQALFEAEHGSGVSEAYCKVTYDSEGYFGGDKAQESTWKSQKIEVTYTVDGMRPSVYVKIKKASKKVLTYFIFNAIVYQTLQLSFETTYK